MKKGQGLSLNVIIIAALALIVLVVLVAIFTGKMGEWTANLKKQETKYCGPVPSDKQGSATSIDGRVVSSATGCDPATETQVYGVFEDVPPNRICCLPR